MFKFPFVLRSRYNKIKNELAGVMNEGLEGENKVLEAKIKKLTSDLEKAQKNDHRGPDGKFKSKK